MGGHASKVRTQSSRVTQWLQHTATLQWLQCVDCNLLQHTATHCNTPQTHCNSGENSWEGMIAKMALDDVLQDFNQDIEFLHMCPQGEEFMVFFLIWTLRFYVCVFGVKNRCLLGRNWVNLNCRFPDLRPQGGNSWWFWISSRVSIVWQDSFMCVIWRIHSYDVTHSYVEYIYMFCMLCDMTHSCLWHDSCTYIYVFCM